MDDLHQDSQTDLPTEYSALYSEYFEASCFSRSVLIGTPVDFKRFYLDSVPWQKVQYHQYPRNRKIHWTLITQEMRETSKSIFPKNLDVSLGPYRETSVSKILSSPPPQKKVDFFSDWVGLFEICFQSSKMTDPRPCPTRWAYFKALSRSTKICQPQINNKLSTAKVDIF